MADLTPINMIELYYWAILPNTKDKRLALILFLASFAGPGNVGIPSKPIAIFWFYDTEGGALVITFPMKILGVKSIPRPLINQIKFILADKIC